MSMTNEMSGANKETDNSNFFVRFFRYFVPWKGDKAQEIVRKIIFIGSIALFCTSLNELTDFLETDKESIEYTDQIQSYEPVFDNGNGDVVSSGLKKVEDTEIDVAAPEKQQRIVQDWAKKLLAKNDEVVGWIKIPGFVNQSTGKEYINFPVLQTDNNDFYLTHNMDKEPYESGSIYVDHAVPIDENGQPRNIIIFGHHMRKLGTSFTHLAEYKESVDMVKKYPIIEFNTIYEQNQEYVIISCFVGIEDATQDNGHIFDYWRYRNFNASEFKFDTWLNNINQCSWYSCDVQCDPTDDYITLSCCSNEVADTRWVIVAKKLDEDDDKDAIIASYKQKKDKDIYFPQVWRDQWGNSRKYLGWSY